MRRSERRLAGAGAGWSRRSKGHAVVLEGEDRLRLEPDHRLDGAGWAPVPDDVCRHLVEHDLDVVAMACMDLPRVQDGAQPRGSVVESLGRRREAENVLVFHERVPRYASSPW